MKLATFSMKHSPDRELIGVIQDDHIYAVSSPVNDMRSLIVTGETFSQVGAPVALDDVLFNPVITPHKVIGVGRNYVAHAEELGNEVPDAPLLFAKFTTSLLGHKQTITWRETITQKVDWEGELAVVIGKTAREIDEADALEYVYGYTIANDISARDLQDMDNQWVRAKGLDTFCPLGPWIVTADEISDPGALHLTTTVNGEVMQDASTDLMIFSIPRLISFCSYAFTLEPGDVILTGTPSGVGKGQNPPRFLKDGDSVSVTIDAIGTLTNSCAIR